MTTPNIAQSNDAPEPTAGVYRDGDDLLVRCGADLSRSCISCGKPVAGKPIVWRFGSGENWSPNTRSAGSDSAIVDLLYAVFLLVSYAMTAAEEHQTRRRQFITFGLCDAHRRRRSWIVRLSLLTILIGLLVFVAGLWGMIVLNRRYGHQTNVFPQMAMIGGPIIGIIGALLIASRLSSLRLAAASDGWMRISGAGPEFLQAQPPLPKTD